MPVRSKHILFVVKTLEYGGVEKHLQELIRRIDDRSIRVTVLCYGRDFYTTCFAGQANVTVVAKQGGEPQSVLTYWLTFVTARPDAIVLVKGWSEEFAFRTYAAAWLSGARTVVAIEHLLADPAPPQPVACGVSARVKAMIGWRTRFLWMKRLEAGLCTHTICVSEGVRERLISEYRFPIGKTIAVVNGVDLKRFSPGESETRLAVRASRGAGEEDVVLVCACRLAPRKRVDVLVNGLDKIPKGLYSWKCWIIGTGLAEPELREQCRRLKLDDRVSFIGFQEDISPFLKAADIYVSLSEKEGLPLSLIEAMACQVPCIATDIPGHDEIVLHGVTGLLVPVGSPDRFAEAAIRLLESRDLRLKMGAAGRMRAEQYFDLERCMAKIRSLL